jgi:hypothetical protein
MKCALAETMSRENQWLTVLPKVKAAFNHTPLPNSGMTPAYLKMGRNIAVCYPPDDITEPLQTPKEVGKSVDEADEFQVNTVRAGHEQNKRQTDKKARPLLLNAGNLVNLWHPFDMHHAGATRKMQSKWSGPYRVLQHNHLKPYHVLIETHPDLNLPYKKLIVHIDHVKLRMPYHGKPTEQKGPGFPLQSLTDPKPTIKQNQHDNDSRDSEDEDFEDGEVGEDTSYFSGPGESSKNDAMENTRENVSGEDVQMENEEQTQPFSTPKHETVPPEMFEQPSLQSTPSQMTPASSQSSQLHYLQHHLLLKWISKHHNEH